MKKKKAGTIIDIYPETPKPDWVKPGVKCHVTGEAQDEFTIDQVLSNRVTLMKGKYAHGAESFTKLTPVNPKLSWANSLREIQSEMIETLNYIMDHEVPTTSVCNRLEDFLTQLDLLEYDIRENTYEEINNV